VVSEQQRQLVLVNTAYRNAQWRLTKTGSVTDLFDLLRSDAVAEEDRHSIAWYRGKSIGHLESTDGLEGSRLLSSLGLSPVECFVHVTVCSDLVLMVDLNVQASDGSIFSRNECRAVSLKRFPTPDQIAEECRKIRKGKPRTDYMDAWVGSEGGGIREIAVKGLFGC
jgi:hypothetical protein